MTTVKAQFDLTLFSTDSVIAAAHRFTGTHAVRIERVGDTALVTLIPRVESIADATADLANAVIDESLRASVRAQTAALHQALVDAAFAALAMEVP